MKNLGKLIVCFLLPLSLMAEVKVSVDKSQVTPGEEVTFTLRVQGVGKVSVPPLDSICGVQVEGRAQRNQEVINNGERKQEIALMYTFRPAKSCIVESFAVTVNNEEFMTKPLNVKVSKMSITKNSPFIVTLKANKKSVYVGEPFEMDVAFKQQQGLPTLGDSISLPESKNIWVKSEAKGSGSREGRYDIHNNVYALSAQQSGKLSLGPLRWDIKVRSRTRDYWGTFVARAQVKTVYSNALDIEVKPLPDDITLVGDFHIKAKVDKTEINAGEAVNLSILLEGRANVEDVEAFSIHLSNAQAFMEDPKVSHYLQNGKYFGTFEQKAALVAQRDFEIPSFSITYMDVESNTVKTISTEPIQVKVLNGAPIVKEELKISRPTMDVKEEPSPETSGISMLEGALLLLGGIVLGFVLSILPWKKLRSEKGAKKAVSAKVSKEVLQVLMSNMNGDKEVEEMVRKISENLYEGKENIIDKKELKEMLKKLT